MISSTTFWLGIGFAGQALFTARFVFQWLASERKRDSVVPIAFWWFSILGGVTLLAYATHRQDPVIIVGQLMGLVVYARNLMLLNKAKRRAAKRQHRIENSEPAAPPERTERRRTHAAKRSATRPNVQI